MYIHGICIQLNCIVGRVQSRALNDDLVLEPYYFCI